MTGLLNDLAPYPTRADSATADLVARHAAVHAQAAFLVNMDHPYFTSRRGEPGHEELLADWRRNLGELASCFKVAFLTRALIEHAGGDVADEVTQKIHDALDDGGAVGEWCWEWLAEYSIDPAKVAEAVATKAATR